jgi:tetratricopeptide (TPR) repeat protein
MLILALLYQQEYKDYEKAEEYYLKAVEKGHAGSMNNLSLLYQQEYKDYKKAEEYFMKAIEKDNNEAIYNLALLYNHEYKDYNMAEEYYLKAIEKGDYKAMNNFAAMLFENKKRKNESFNYAKKSVYLEKCFTNLYLLILVSLWNDDIESAISVWKNDLFNEEYIDERKKEITKVLNFFIAKKQYNFVYKLFVENKFEIKEKYKPVYYALLSFMGEKYSDKFKKMGPELKETVDEIIEEINRLAEEYK